jgi:cytochrome c-type biogenesis protein CcmH
MIVFWIAAAVLSALAATLMLRRAAGAARRPDFDPALAVYRRQLTEIDDLAERGLLPTAEYRVARAEAARRLLSVSQSAPDPAPPVPATRRARMAVLAVALAAPILALGLYLVLGSPGAPDQPFRQRLADWRAADPSTLNPAALAAVLDAVVKERPGDVRALVFLARAQASAGNASASVETLRKAVRTAPRSSIAWSNLGQALVLQNQDNPTPEAVDAFRHALTFDPKDAPSRYYLARARIVNGDVAGGLADWRALAADLQDDDPTKPDLMREIDATAQAGHLAAAQPAQAAPDPGADQRAFIQSMVDRLAAELKANPDNPAGWARLIRSYAVLGDNVRMQAALDEAHQRFRGRPDAIKTIEAALTGPQQ